MISMYVTEKYRCRGIAEQFLRTRYAIFEAYKIKVSRQTLQIESLIKLDLNLMFISGKYKQINSESLCLLNNY